jgi:hypothetical protein
MKAKLFVIGVLLLFLGVALAPSINIQVVKASSEDELVEVTSEVCGIKGFGNTTVKLTQQQAREVEEIFNSVQQKMDAAKSREEVQCIFDQAVVDLNKYGLLGKLSVEQAQELVTGRNINDKVLQRAEMLLSKKPFISNSSNFMSLVSGHVDISSMFFQGPVTRTLSFLSVFFIYLGILFDQLVWKILYSLPYWLSYLIYIIYISANIPELYIYFFGLTIIGTSFWTLITSVYSPLFIASAVGIGVNNNPCPGEISSYGSAGKKIWNGLIKGNIPLPEIFDMYLYEMENMYDLKEFNSSLAMVGYTGLKIILQDSYEYLFLGFTPWIDIETVR